MFGPWKRTSFDTECTVEVCHTFESLHAHVDLDGDIARDWVVDEAGFLCSSAASLYCGTGGRSALAAKSLDDMGFRNVKSMDGGIVAWAEARHPIDFPG